ncbi:MAG: HAMP domain-containing histidine kinase [Sphingobacteriia bacterium]|nr:HAMP domain-containing histidine kinase [Sphingobacteriia bacterium]
MTLELKNLLKQYYRFLPTLRNISRISAKRVANIGAHYKSFGAFAIASFFIPYYMWSNPGNIMVLNQDISIFLRFIAGILAFGLIIHDMWPRKLVSYLPLYWHVTLMYSLPFFTTFLFLYNQGTVEWLINVALSLFLLAVLTDWLSFTVLLSIGTTLGYNLYIYLLGSENISQIFSDPHKIHLFFYVTFFSTIIGMLFSRNREILQKSVVDMLELKAKERTKDLEEALLLKKEFLSNLNHEIRTPIMGIIGYCNGLYDNWKEFNEEKKLVILNRLNNSVDRLYTFVDNIFDLSKFETGKMHLQLEKFDIKGAIEEIISDTGNMNIKENLSIKLNIETSTFLIEADRFKTKQVIRNLISNAFKYTSEGNIIISIKNGKEIRKDGSQVKGIVVSVQDEGIGIPDDELELIFDPFSQSTRTKSMAGGRGLSLSVSRKIIEAHLGKIWAVNNKDKGATFAFIIPQKG